MNWIPPGLQGKINHLPQQAQNGIKNAPGLAQFMSWNGIFNIRYHPSSKMLSMSVDGNGWQVPELSMKLK